MEKHTNDSAIAAKKHKESRKSETEETENEDDKEEEEEYEEDDNDDGEPGLNTSHENILATRRSTSDAEESMEVEMKETETILTAGEDAPKETHPGFTFLM